MSKLTVTCPGSCGELIQGYINNNLYLVSCSIDAYAYFSIDDSQCKSCSMSKKVGEKAMRAMKRSAELLNTLEDKWSDVKVDLSSELSISKGMASSTADISAVSYGMSVYNKTPFTPVEVSKICTEIESTDSTMFKSLTLFDAKNANVIEQSDWSPKFHLLMLEPESILDTEAFHTVDVDQAFQNQQEAFCDVLKIYQEAINQKNLEKLGECATRSALLNQEILPKPFFNELLEFKGNFSSILGINVAHSGTVVGIIVRNLTEKESIIKDLEEKGITSFYSKITIYNSCFEGIKIREGARE